MVSNKIFLFQDSGSVTFGNGTYKLKKKLLALHIIYTHTKYLRVYPIQKL